MEYLIWCDESVKDGEYYSNFYGGALVSSHDYVNVINKLAKTKKDLNLYGEIKWVKVTENYLDKYISVMKVFFGLVKSGKIKIRIMFTQNCHVPVGLTKEQQDNSFFLLYYQFIKHSFGFTVIDRFRERVHLKLFFDKLPDKEEKKYKFKDYVYRFNRFLNEKNVFIRREDIAEVISHKHDILQCLDIVLGSMSFRLNDKHKEKNGPKRGKRTVAKEKLYKYICSQIRAMYPGFNIGISTGSHSGSLSHWEMSYRHWRFIPKNATYDGTKTKQ